MKIFLCLFSFLFLSHRVYTQQGMSLLVSVDAYIDNKPIVLADSFYQLQNGYQIKIETLKFYISNIQIQSLNKTCFKERNSYHLIDFSEKSSTSFVLENTCVLNNYDLNFDLGIDSFTNVSGAMAGDLDPMMGMYWTWQSGYINAKIEGKCLNCGLSTKNFEYHLGGYQNPFLALQTVTLILSDKNKVEIILDLDTFFNNMDISKQKNIMSPSAEAVKIAHSLSKNFSLK